MLARVIPSPLSLEVRAKRASKDEKRGNKSKYPHEPTGRTNCAPDDKLRDMRVRSK